MAKEICISSTPHETRLAILEDDQLAEIYYERENEYTLAGSIYNGRVTRVLPGMQSAFVDLGLERDAFLYVTDFLEMEDPEESDEVEKAASTGSNQAPREVRGGGEVRKQESKSEGKQEGRRDRGDRNQERGQERAARQERAPEPVADPRLSIEPEGEAQTFESAVSPRVGEDSSAEPKRWRGRRRRRGRGQGASGAEPVETEASGESFMEADAPAPAQESEIQAAGTEHRFAEESRPERPERTDRPERVARPERSERSDRSDRNDRSERPARGGREATPFVLPGESLSKYGGEPAAETSSKQAAPARPSNTFKPSSMIQSPIVWDGSGLLPGESISRHRRNAEAPPQALGEPEGTFANAEEILSAQSEAPVHKGESDDTTEALHFTPATSGPVEEYREFEMAEEETFPDEPVPAAHEVQAPVAGEPEGHFETPESQQTTSHEEHWHQHGEARRTSEPGGEIVSEALIGETGDIEANPEDDEENRSASHHVDPLPPSEFRLFGLGGKKKRDGEGDDHGPEYSAIPAIPSDPAGVGPVASGATGPTSVRSMSAFAPGAGLVEEETIEEEEFEAPGHRHHKHDEHDLDEYEEVEKVHGIRGGDLGEMLQEAHLDHRIQLNFDEKNGDADDDFDSEEDDEEDAGEEQTQAEGAAPAEPSRRDRGGRGRRNGGREQRGNNRRGGPSRRSAQTSDLPIISDLLKPGQEILVQIAKEPIAKKGARITSHIALPGRFLVFMPTVSHVGVSRKIASEEERQRLKRILVSERGEASGGFIVRTAAEGASEEELRADLRFLLHLWDEIKDRSEKAKSPALIYHDLSLIERILRDQVSENFSSIWVDSQDDYERIVRFLNRFAPTMVRRVKLYTKETPLFEHFGIQDEISKALRSKVWLKSGGSIVINQTEALVAIDINTGKYVGKTARLEDTIVKTNLDAIPEIVRQIRLRDLGGIIIIDFIDMDERKNRFKVMAALEEALKTDRAPTKVLQFNDFGLVAITRKRVKQSLERTLSVPCPTCQATGMVKSPATVANEIYIELRKMRKHFENPDVLLRVNPETVKALKANNARWITDFEDLTGKNILIKSDAALHPEQFDIQG